MDKSVAQKFMIVMSMFVAVFATVFVCGSIVNGSASADGYLQPMTKTHYVISYSDTEIYESPGEIISGSDATFSRQSPSRTVTQSVDDTEEDGVTVVEFEDDEDEYTSETSKTYNQDDIDEQFLYMTTVTTKLPATYGDVEKSTTTVRTASKTTSKTTTRRTTAVTTAKPYTPRTTTTTRITTTKKKTTSKTTQSLTEKPTVTTKQTTTKSTTQTTTTTTTTTTAATTKGTSEKSTTTTAKATTTTASTTKSTTHTTTASTTQSTTQATTESTTKATTKATTTTESTAKPTTKATTEAKSSETPTTTTSRAPMIGDAARIDKRTSSSKES